MAYEIQAEMFQRENVVETDHAVTCGTEIEKDHDRFCPWPYQVGDSVGPKFDSAAAAIVHVWSLDSSQDDTCGDAQYGNGWHALFRDERIILHTGNQGFVSAWRVEEGTDIDAEWTEINKGAVTEGDIFEGYNDPVNHIGCFEI